ncbi:CPBP family intramembrane metalloprotease [Bacillus aquiflavi]|uniref:CPBP family intramembrane metalloprotease n=1 Tax=Bacillus aquiflavi TaxID=2672567 RepID=A0A6B3W103_9BACI|nr:CPBP family intramembrane glutamic endopeptidase [Bacillus aquiflavi]MBA4538509.1 CPBP family intramembrane metalloprotease [Bacillus aquiflavi]NEY82872.1 CPBP family intramembrane metalloprotease [Bacillus aquiflavi]UAC49565.1 CPBP family intramembrane metalloprotease [Bacillus aquiflavi]
MKGTQYPITVSSILLSAVFLLMYLFFQLQLYNGTFLIMFVLLLSIVFLKEKNRVFAWTIIAFFLGEMLLLYGNQLIDQLPISHSWSEVVKSLLILFPLLFIFYISKKFKVKFNIYNRRPKWEKAFSLRFSENRSHVIRVKQLFIALWIIFLIVFFLLIMRGNVELLNKEILFGMIVFSIVNGILEEILWRGVLLTKFVSIVGEHLGLLFISIAFGFSVLSVEHALAFVPVFFIIGLLFGKLTVSAKSIIVAINLHIVFNLLMFLTH